MHVALLTYTSVKALLMPNSMYRFGAANPALQTVSFTTLRAAEIPTQTKMGKHFSRGAAQRSSCPCRTFCEPCCWHQIQYERSFLRISQILLSVSDFCLCSLLTGV